MKKLFKIVTFVFALSMVLGLGMAKEAWAWGATVHICPHCLKTSDKDLNENNVGHFHTEDCEYSIRNTNDSALSINVMMTLEEYEAMNSSSTDINLTNSVESVQYDTLNRTDGTTYYSDETTNIWADGQIVEECRVTVALESTFTITIPKEIVLDGNTKKADYTVNVQGDIAGDQLITVQPDASFEMSEAGGKTNITATVSQTGSTFPYMLISSVDGETVDGSVEAPDMTAGTWSGKFNFNIKFGENDE